MQSFLSRAEYAGYAEEFCGTLAEGIIYCLFKEFAEVNSQGDFFLLYNQIPLIAIL